MSTDRRSAVTLLGRRIVFLEHEGSVQVRRHWMASRWARQLGGHPEAEWRAHECAAAQGLAPALHAVDLEQGWLQMQRVDGVHLPPDWLRHAVHCRQLLWALRQLRALPCSNLPRLSLIDRCVELHARLRERDAVRARTHDASLRVVVPMSPWQDRADVLPAVLVHGDLHAGNVLVHGVTPRWCLLDWEYAHRGHDLEDLAGVLAEDRQSFEQLEQGRGALATALRESDWSPSLERLRRAVAIRQLLNGLWTDLYDALQKDAATLE